VSLKSNAGAGFSLVEVVLALGVVAFAIVAILGIVPTGLSSSHGAQDETRAAGPFEALGVQPDDVGAEGR